MNLRRFVGTIADVEQPKDELRYHKSRNPVNPRLTPADFENDLVQYSLGTELDQVSRILVVVSGALA